MKTKSELIDDNKRLTDLARKQSESLKASGQALRRHVDLIKSMQANVREIDALYRIGRKREARDLLHKAASIPDIDTVVTTKSEHLPLLGNDNG